MKLINGCVSYLATPPTACAYCNGDFPEEEGHRVGFKGEDGQVYCSPEHVVAAYQVRLLETELGGTRQ